MMLTSFARAWRHTTALHREVHRAPPPLLVRARSMVASAATQTSAPTSPLPALNIYEEFAVEASKIVGSRHVVRDPLRRLAYGNDASFYRLVPRIVVEVSSEDEVQRVLPLAKRMRIPLTFRAAGTSLSGQAVTDSVLLRIIPSKWNKCQVIHKCSSHAEGECTSACDASAVRLQPGIIGGVANGILNMYGKRIGPDPSSIDACMIGGIVANNSSGMCCGVELNTYNTLKSMRIILADGTLLDTSSESSKAQFERSHGHLLEGLRNLAQQIRNNATLRDKIKQKYKIKNTTGYSLNALVDFEDPFEILQHLIVGSEGTLAFIAEVVMRTIDELPFKSTSLMLFHNIHAACNAVHALESAPVAAVELMDRGCLRSAELTEAKSGTKISAPMVIPSGLGNDVSSLLVETHAKTKEQLAYQTQQILGTIHDIPTVTQSLFTDDPVLRTNYWNVRKALIPLVGAHRPASTSVIIEDVAVSVPQLAPLTLDLQRLFAEHGYDDAIVFGHALSGNLHLLFAQGFESKHNIDRYQQLMDGLCTLVAQGYNGSLKAEHGTGRNMAPFVELEWGSDAYFIMKRIKELFDADYVLNPGVVLNSDSLVHIKNLKPMPMAHPTIDTCIECGFCERACPSRELTITPRQRITTWREISRLRRLPTRDMTEEDRVRLQQLEASFEYDGDATCAADGMCSVRCPVSINTGKLIKAYRADTVERRARWQLPFAALVASNMGMVVHMARLGLTAARFTADHILGEAALEAISRQISLLSGRKTRFVPHWLRTLPAGAPGLPSAAMADEIPSDKAASDKTLIYFPSCSNRMFGAAPSLGPNATTLHSRVRKLVAKAGFQAVLLPKTNSHCCGLAFESHGFPDLAAHKARELLEELRRLSHNGQVPVVCDMSQCCQFLSEVQVQPSPRPSITEAQEQLDTVPLEILEPVTLVQRVLAPYLEFQKQTATVALHVSCSAKKMGLTQAMTDLVSKCATEVVDSEVPCCGMAGDRGLLYPELPASSLSQLRERVNNGSRSGAKCSVGYSNSRTCEMALSLHSDVTFTNLLDLVDAATSAKSPEVIETDKQKYEQDQ